MKAIESVNWDTVDLDKILGDYIELPDGTQHYIEMEMLIWQCLEFMKKRGHTVDSIAKDAFDTMKRHPGSEFDGIFKTAIMAYCREWVRINHGR